MFQAYGTQRALEKLGYDSEFINLYTREEEKKNENKSFALKLKPLLIYMYARLNPKLQLKYKRFREFHGLMKLTKRYYNIEEIYNNPPNFDLHLVGSDQVWNLQRGFQNPPYYFLGFLGKDEKRISYASSFGTKNIDKKYNSRLKELLSCFSAISVREDDGVQIIKEACDLEATQVLDPTFLMNAKEWGELATKERLIKEDYVLYYGFDNSELSRQLIINLKKRLGLPVVAVSGGVSFPFKVDYFVKEAGPREFLSLFKNASFICTSSFHGLAFAIHFRKSFLTIKHPQRNSRMETVLNKFDLFDRQVKNANDLLIQSDEEFFVDYSKIEDKIEFERTRSLNWLENNIANLIE
ncbi:polysaccharide pyruvyl transferase family protein [Maribacter sp. TH_r10]|uniref:polysaccharide pyruvyl transferase family protein n=1 Tax=Maribacter sp. TH_r10 TaxID=3082086 RepID=UPI002952F2DB|nr:polysaccharide pyruvyl transferase family protein [Maribacter sp. TH_r10]MDV7140198.1 polysaccharide pyruvyl transferase family protein [Maribacter sp. TH_r10]